MLVFLFIIINITGVGGGRVMRGSLGAAEAEKAPVLQHGDVVALALTHGSAQGADTCSDRVPDLSEHASTMANRAPRHDFQDIDACTTGLEACGGGDSVTNEATFKNSDRLGEYEHELVANNMINKYELVAVMVNETALDTVNVTACEGNHMVEIISAAGDEGHDVLGMLAGPGRVWCVVARAVC